jgi:hypothetical protein
LTPADPHTVSIAIGAFGGGFGAASLLWGWTLRRDLPRLVRGEMATKVVALADYRAAAASAEAVQRQRRAQTGP